MEEQGAEVNDNTPQVTFYDVAVQITRDRMNTMLPLLVDETKCAILRAANNGKTTCFFPKSASREQVQAMAKAFRQEGFHVTDNKLAWDKGL